MDRADDKARRKIGSRRDGWDERGKPEEERQGGLDCVADDGDSKRGRKKGTVQSVGSSTSSSRVGVGEVGGREIGCAAHLQ